MNKRNLTAGIFTKRIKSTHSQWSQQINFWNKIPSNASQRNVWDHHMWLVLFHCCRTASDLDSKWTGRLDRESSSERGRMVPLTDMCLSRSKRFPSLASEMHASCIGSNATSENKPCSYFLSESIMIFSSKNAIEINWRMPNVLAYKKKWYVSSLTNKTWSYPSGEFST